MSENINNLLNNKNVDTREIGSILLQKIRDMSPISGTELSIEQNAKEWKEMCEEFNRITNEKSIKIPKSEFEEKYSKFYNPKNMDLLRKGTTQFESWREDCNEFLKRIDPYRPFEVVDDNDPTIVIRTFPPIFRMIDTLNTPNLGKGIKRNYDAEGNIIDTNYLSSVVNNVFDKLGTHQLRAVRDKGTAILHGCVHGVQDPKTIEGDIEATDFILKKFILDCKEQNEHSIYNENNKNKKDNNTSNSLEDYGVEFD